MQRTADEALVEYKKTMGDGLGAIFHHLLQETWHLTSIWDQHETLFENKDRISLLNSSGGSFFRNVQDIFFNHVLLGLCRLTDPPRSSGKENLTINRLPSLVRAGCREAVIQATAEATTATEFCRDWRNRLIAHNDLARYTKVAPPLKGATRLGVTAALVAIHEVLRIIAMEYKDTDLVLLEIGDDAAFQLLHQLRRGRDARTEQKARLATGDFRSSDYDFPDWLKPPDVGTRYRRKRH